MHEGLLRFASTLTKSLDTVGFFSFKGMSIFFLCIPLLATLSGCVMVATSVIKSSYADLIIGCLQVEVFILMIVGAISLAMRVLRVRDSFRGNATKDRQSPR